MEQRIFHTWNLSAAAGKKIQARLAELVIVRDAHRPIRRVAGVDAAYSKNGHTIAGAAVVLEAESLEVLEQAVVLGTTSFPYIPGLFAFRELPAVIAALKALARPPRT